MTEGCACVNVEMGSYDAQIEMVPPWGVREDGRGICVDACIALEVHRLWQQGIRTTGCCCGHNTAPAYIGVREEHIPGMLRLGYEVLPNTSRPGARDSFRARSAPPKEAEPWRPDRSAVKAEVSRLQRNRIDFEGQSVEGLGWANLDEVTDAILALPSPPDQKKGS